MWKKIMLLGCGGVMLGGMALWAAASEPVAEKKARTVRDDIPLRKCFSDGNQNLLCDRSINDGGKCRRNCVKSANPEKVKYQAPLTPCVNCPAAGNCEKCGFVDVLTAKSKKK